MTLMHERYSDRALRPQIEDQSVAVSWHREGNRLTPIPVGATVRIGRDPLATRDEGQR